MNAGRDGTDSTGELLAEVEALRAENDRLRGLLGLDERRDDGHAHAWTTTLPTEKTDRPSVDASSSDVAPEPGRRRQQRRKPGNVLFPGFPSSGGGRI